jgi:glucan 1,3-beta-glucosidase
MIGEIWSQILVKGSVFNDQNNPHVALKFGNTGDVGTLRVTNMLVRFVAFVSVQTKRIKFSLYSTFAGSVGAIAMEINVQESFQGSVGFWDTVRGYLL